MAEWHLTPEYILDNWTEEKFSLMTQKLVERKQRLNKPAPPKVNDTDLFAQASNLVKVVSRGD